jgi:hypothetical protein
MRKVAFLVGNDTFPKDPSIAPLRFTQNDARELAEVLENPETCGFETRLYLNRPSQEVLTDFDQVSGELEDDTLSFLLLRSWQAARQRIVSRFERNNHDKLRGDIDPDPARA